MAPDFKNQMIALLCLILVCVLDFLSPMGIAVGILYVVVFHFITKQTKKVIVIFTITTMFLILLKLLIFFNEADQKSLLNRGISLVSILSISVFSIRKRRLYDKLENDRNKYIELLKRKQLKLQTYQKSINLYLLVTTTDVKGNITFANDAFCRVSKYSREELQGQNHRLLKSGEHPDDFYKGMWQNIGNGITWRAEVKSKAKDGSFFWTDTVIIPIKNEKNQISEFFALRLLITDKKEYQQEQEENLKTFKAILWDVSHKLRGPITTCIGMTNLLEENADKMNELEQKGLKHRKTCTSELDKFSREITEFIYSRVSKKS